LREARVTRSAFAAAARGDKRAALYPEVIATLDALTAGDTALGAVTSLPGWMANAMLAGLQLDRFLGTVVTYERTPRRKPHADPLLLALGELGVEPSRKSWYVGDTAADGRAAAAAGLSFAVRMGELGL
jgi:pyrophosphatase PpaX